jgi:hypothetical protein
MRLIKIFLFVVILFISGLISAQNYSLENNSFKVKFKNNGTITGFISNGNNVEFRNDSQFEGPSVYLSGARINLRNISKLSNKLGFGGENQYLNVTVEYSFENNAFAVRTTIKNKSGNPIPVDDIMLRLGINTEMDLFPHWNKIYFPTMMRCEKDFFWGYLMNPEGSVLTIVSPDPVASWNNSYKSYEHRIFTTNLDLMHSLPLPSRHPQDLNMLKVNESKTWVVYLELAVDLQDVKTIAASLSKAVIISSPQYTLAENETFHFNFSGEARKLRIITPGQKVVELKPSARIDFKPDNGVGQYKLIAESKDQKTSEAIFSVRKPWSWYLKNARLNAIEQEQKAGSHTESWYGLFSMFLAQKYFPDEILLKTSLDKFNELYPLMYDELDLPRKIIVFGNLDMSGRIQNTSCMASLLAAMYSVLNDTSYLAKASRLCDFLTTKQDLKGAYRSGEHVHYTSVVYIAKSILEVCRYEKMLATGNNIWQRRYERHFASAKKAVDELTASLDNIETEGEMTYEDGMIACSYTQIAMMATQTSDLAERDKYIKAAEYLRKGHRCLSQLLIPDSRMNGCSLRYWESQYDILSFPNLISSPHGWSAWRIYGLYYLYQLTGNPELIEQIYNALGSCVQLIDEKTGVLRWAFCVDPFVTGDPELLNPYKPFSHDEMRGSGLLVKDPAVKTRENKGMRIDIPVGEQYLNMISGWYKAVPNSWVTGYWEPDGGCCDNDVHEIFKCLEETVLTSGYVVEQNDGSIRPYNCKITFIENTMEVIPDENIIDKVHFNMKKDIDVRIHIGGKIVNATIKNGEMKWITL